MQNLFEYFIMKIVKYLNTKNFFLNILIQKLAMPPNNFLVPSTTPKTTDDGGSSNDEHSSDANTTSFLNVSQ